MPREGNDTLRRGYLQPYKLVHVTLQDDFHDDICTQLTAEALRVAAPIARTEIRGRVLEKGLNDVIEKIAALLEGGAVESARRGVPFLQLTLEIRVLHVQSTQLALKPFNPFAQFANRLPPGPEHVL